MAGGSGCRVRGGLSKRSLVAAALQVALVLTGARVRAAVLRQHGLRELIAFGCAIGLLLVVADVRVEPVIPFLALLVGWRAWRLLLAWITAP